MSTPDIEGLVSALATSAFKEADALAPGDNSAAFLMTAACHLAGTILAAVASRDANPEGFILRAGPLVAQQAVERALLEFPIYQAQAAGRHG